MRHTLSSFLVIAILSACASRSTSDSSVLQQPETSTGFRDVERSSAASFMVSTANPESTQAAIEVIQAGGSAIDAVIAAQMVLTVVEPQSSGIGGGAFLLHYDSTDSTVIGYDGREQAPSAMGPRAFLKEDGTRLSFKDAVVGGLSVGAPGVVAALEAAHREHGELPWARLFDSAIGLARDGWQVHPRLANGLKSVPALLDYAGKNSMYYDGEGNTRQVGERVTNPELAVTFEQLAEGGSDVFYRGAIGEAIVEVVANAKRPGLLTVDDLARYAPEKREGVCLPYRTYQVCGFPPPAGSLVAVTILKLLERFDLASLEPNGSEFLHLYAQASELAYSDRDTYYGDPAATSVPVDALLDAERLAAGSRLITTEARSSEPMRMPVVAVTPDRDVACELSAANGPGPSE
ncbi:MAG: gamma-glutamyltransferase, partial [Myxococcota bacterium]